MNDLAIKWDKNHEILYSLELFKKEPEGYIDETFRQLTMINSMVYKQNQERIIVLHNVNSVEIDIESVNRQDYSTLDLISCYVTNPSTILKYFVGKWEQLKYPKFQGDTLSAIKLFNRDKKIILKGNNYFSIMKESTQDSEIISMIDDCIDENKRLERNYNSTIDSLLKIAKHNRRVHYR